MKCGWFPYDLFALQEGTKIQEVPGVQLQPLLLILLG